MMSDHITTRIPFDVLKHVDEAHNPEFITRERIERVAAENQFAYAKIAALDVREEHRCCLPNILNDGCSAIAPSLMKLWQRVSRELKPSLSSRCQETSM